MTQIEHELWANDVRRECLLEARNTGSSTDAALMAAEYIIAGYRDLQPLMLRKGSVNVSLANDVADPRTQSILDQALRAARSLTAEARKSLQSALRKSESDNGRAILAFVDKYRVQLAELLNVAQLAALLEGAHGVAAKIPQIDADAEAINKLVGDIPLPTILIKPALSTEDAHGTALSTTPWTGNLFSTISNAIRSLISRNVMTRSDYDVLDAAARAKAFTVAGIDAEDTLAKIRGALAENIQRGADLDTFSKDVMDAMDEGTFLSDAHLETVFRTNVQTAFSDGQMTVLSNPLVRDGFPYSAYDAIHDDRVRHEHLQMENHGIDGSNIYRNDDPVFQTFRPPWSYNCRCSWTPLTLRQAASAGVVEAQEWLRTGHPPTAPAHVAMPPFAPPPGFQRALASAPLSVRLSSQPVALFNQAARPHHARPSITSDNYPRDNAGRFLDKLAIARAARDHDEAAGLHESIPEDQRWKLDHAISHLQTGGTIHHPGEPPGMAVDIQGNISDWRWAEYYSLKEAREAWEERNTDRTERRQAVEQAVKLIRKDKHDLDEIDNLLDSAGISSAELRSLARARHRANTTEGQSDELTNTYEDVAEAIHQRLDRETEDDREPLAPEEPSGSEVPTDPRSPAFGMVGNEWHGPNPPGDGWVPIAPGPRGGKRWRRTDGARADGRTGEPRGKRRDAGAAIRDSGGMEDATTGPSTAKASGIRRGGGKPTDTRTDRAGKPEQPDQPSESDQKTIDRINKGLEQYQEKFRKSGQTAAADWIGSLKQHINEVGVKGSVSALYDNDFDPTSPLPEKVAYKGSGYFPPGPASAFLRKYLGEAGIILQSSNRLSPKSKVIASAPVPGARVAKPGDVTAQPTNVETKLEESKLLPGLESSEDINKVVGHEVRQFTPGVIKKLDNVYGKNRWIVKSYGDEAYAGFGVFFPQRLAEIKRNARQELWDANRKLGKYGYTLARDKNNEIVGIQSKTTNNVYKFGSKEYSGITNKEVKRIGNMASASAPQEKGARLPATSEDSLRQDYGILLVKDKSGKVTGVTNEEGKHIQINTPEWKALMEWDEQVGYPVDRAIGAAESSEPLDSRFMVQPAFEAVGVSDRDRALGYTWETSNEGRVHVVTRNGKASVVPYATLAGRSDVFPVVFKNDDIRAMEKAVQDTIDALPESERAGQVYAPDVMKTKDGWRVVELNASVETGSSLWLEENPFVIDAFVSHIVGREPSHARFIRELLTGEMGPRRAKIKTAPAGPHAQAAPAAPIGKPMPSLEGNP